MQKKEMVAMLLAGGQGNRLYVLTKALAKPAVPFGGKYRIIDFTLSNCSNSGIDTVGVLTQYQPLELHRYIGSGHPWDLDRVSGGVHILPPYTGKDAGWYKGTANAIYQNRAFIDSYQPEYVLILSGDHVYQMDYDKMLAYHKAKGADATIAVLSVPIDEASRFGIMNTRDDNRIYAFEEKPEHPKSNKASMGIYIFNWQKLRQYLTIDEAMPTSSNDFGKDIIPAMLSGGEKMFAYPFEGYWKDVGTIDSLWDANMDMLNPALSLKLADTHFPIYGRNESLPPHFVGEGAVISESMVCGGCEIYGDIWYSSVFPCVTLDMGSTLNSAVVMKNAKIGKNCKICYAIIANDVIIEDDVTIGCPPEESVGGEKWGIAVIGAGAHIKRGTVVKAGEMIDPASEA